MHVNLARILMIVSYSANALMTGRPLTAERIQMRTWTMRRTEHA
ncbi:hypothetical protein Mesau_05664 [Mesorhizobium australicum WSM2073]|uniref:Uncharacterized protein n=3 Tax=Mesorhizobium TaxID=68287 RepID=L0KV58_MESAW|nr:hypothetical protein Mesci_5612 [Mesorhizobium ciceri biovar biserrulae WSM1271]AEH90591.1 hypothetical protein Mesop_6196 [Mesorhizobium opportunistum WSM2075]AGB47963.1 hypothetical protein Mesau_05664 [Mesorhizobium australicum WSM2073]